jgi:hypothetical protein
MVKRLVAAIAVFALITGPSASAQQDQGGAQGQVPTQDPNGPTQAVAAATQLPPPEEVGFVQKAKDWAADHQLMERLNGDVDGWYPRLGGMTRGGGFAVGPGYRLHFGDVLVDLSAGLSTKTYKAADVKVRWLQSQDERFEFWTTYRFEDFPQEDFFGLGLSSVKAQRTSYDFDGHDIQAMGIFKPLPWLRVGADVGHMWPDVNAGTDRNYPSIEQLFTDADAPGLLEQPSYLHTTFFADVDYRDQRGRPRSGGFYHAAMGFWNDRSFDRYDFKRFDANASQYFPLDTDKRHVVMGRVGLSYANNETGSRVPFYLLPYVGGVDTVRSFNEFRFKDENALWMTAEYNWTMIKWIGLAAFIDAGKVAADWQDIKLSGLKKGYGFGVRVHSSRQTFARIDMATGGGEGWTMFLKLGPSF